MQKILKYFGISLLTLLLIAGIWAVSNGDKLKRLQATITLFDQDKIIHNFSNMNAAFLSQPILRDGPVFEFGSSPRNLPDSFEYKGEEQSSEEFLQRRATTALLVIKDDAITFEAYYLGTKETDLRISWSMAKSFTSALMGILVNDGLVDIEKPVTHYLPSLLASGYEDVRVKDVLQMSSGIAWNEDYADFFSDINRMGREMALDGSLDEFASTLVRGEDPGTVWRYVSMDTHVLGMIVRTVSGKRLSDYLEQQIWSKIGMESDGYFLTDSLEAEFALGGVNARTRDYARFGRLYLNEGNWLGEQLIPRSWVKASVTPDAPHITGNSDSFGYGYQWWVAPDARPGEFVAVGVYGQFVYINQSENVVIVKNSADLDFMDEIGSMHESVQFFRQVTDSFISSVDTPH